MPVHTLFRSRTWNHIQYTAFIRVLVMSKSVMMIHRMGWGICTCNPMIVINVSSKVLCTDVCIHEQSVIQPGNTGNRSPNV